MLQRSTRTLAAAAAAAAVVLALTAQLTNIVANAGSNVVASATISGRITNRDAVGLGNSHVVAYSLDTGASFTAETDEDGNYQVGVQQAGNYRLSGSHFTNDYLLTFWTSTGGVTDYLQAEPIAVPEGQGQPLTGYDIALFRISTVSGRVTDNAGIPISGIQVSPRPLDDYCLQCFSDYSDVNGEYTISVEPGRYWIFFSGGLYREEWWNSSGGSYQEEVVVGIEEDRTVTDVQLSRYGMVTGMVRDSQGSPVPDATVTATGPVCCSQETVTDANGQYTMIALVPGAYIIGAGAPGYETAYWTSTGSVPSAAQAEPVNSQLDTVLWDIDIVLNPKGSISGRLTDSGGNPIPFAGVVASRNNFECCEYWYAPADETGTYKIVDLQTGDYKLRGGGPADQYALVYYTASGGSTDINQAEAVPVVYGLDSAVAEFHLLRFGSISGRVTDMGGVPLAGAEVSAWLPGCSGCVPSTWTDDFGNYRFAALEPGDYRVGAGPSGYMFGYWNSSGTVVSWDDAGTINPLLEQEVIGIDLRLPRPASIRGRVVDGAGNPIQGTVIPITIAGCPACGGPGITDGDGEYIIWNIRPGDVTLYAYKAGYTSMYWTSGGGSPWQPETIHIGDGEQLTGYDFTLSLMGFLGRDVDCRGDVSAVDALEILRHVAALLVSQDPGCRQIGTGDPLQGDFNCDGRVDAIDALGILRYVARLTGLPPLCPPPTP